MKLQRWTVISEAEPVPFGNKGRVKFKWHCVCECGTEQIVDEQGLKSGRSRSCGCIRKDKWTYEARNHPLFMRWYSMIQRCHNPMSQAYENYGARGIIVSEEFRSEPEGFWNYVDHVGLPPSPEMTIDRIDNDGNYERGNLRWADSLTQVFNRRNSVQGHSGKKVDGITVIAPSPTYKSYKHMNNRHQGRDMVCARWMKSKGGGFNNFLEDMGIRPDDSTLKRYDVNLPFSQENCYWGSH